MAYQLLYKRLKNSYGEEVGNKGIYTAVSGAIAQSARLDTISNNIANSNTNSFKKDRQVFNEYITSNEKLPDVIKVPRVPAAIESFYDMQGGDKAYVNKAGSYTDFTQGQLQPTGNHLDVALEGKGFFEVLTPQGTRLTRQGAFKVDSLGRLVTKQGYPVLSSGLGQAAAQRTIQVDSTRNITVGYSGDIFVNGEQAGTLSTVDVKNADSLQKVGQNFYKIKPNYGEQLVAAENIKTRQGFVEKSNVNIVSEMTNMITATRIFESTMQAIKAFDSMNSKLVNDVPKLR